MQLRDTDLLARLATPDPSWRSRSDLRDSAVLIPVVRRGGEDRLLFNKRRDDLPSHPGQVCFPGGAREGDEPADRCAVRETCEEMGVAPEQIEVLGRLPDRISIAGYLVAVFAARLDPAAELRPLEAEVADVFEVPFRWCLEKPRWTHRRTTHPKAVFEKIPYFESGSHVVWGLTGIILRDFVGAVADFDPRR